MTCLQIASSLKPPSVWPVSKSFQIRSRASKSSHVFDRKSFSSLELISDGVGLRGGCLHDFHITSHPRKQKPLRIAAGLSTPQSVAGAVETVKWAFTASPASLESAAIAVSTIFVAGAPVLLAGLTLSGYACAYLLGFLTWKAFGWQGTFIVSVYFVLGTLATKVKIKQKEAAGIAEKRSGRRGPGSVFGSWTAGALCAAATVTDLGGLEWQALWRLGFLASFCTKLSDTISSEIGKAFGKTTYLVTSFSIVPRGTEGAISLEGTVAGLIASVILAAVAQYVNLTDQTGAVICVVAAQVANFCESYIGAALQGREGYEWITNDVANIVNITIGASLAAAIRSLIG